MKQFLKRLKDSSYKYTRFHILGEQTLGAQRRRRMPKYKRLIEDFLYALNWGFLYPLFPNYYYRKALKQNRQAEEKCRIAIEKSKQRAIEEWKNNPDNEEEEK